MNVDFLALSSAVQQANNVTAVGMDMDSAPRKVPLRRRSSKAGTSASALQFLEAAHKSWSDLPDDLGETTALQRRKSLRSDRTGTDGSKVVLSPEVGHRSWTFGENRKNNDTTDSPLLKEGSSKVLPPRGGSCRVSRRASMGGKKKTPTIAEEPSVPDTDDDEPVKEKTSKRGKLTRRSSLQVASDHSRSKEKTASKENSTGAGRRTTGASAENSRSAGAGGGGAGPRMVRRNTVSHCTNMDDSNTESLTKPPPPPPQKPTRQSSLSANGSSSKINGHHQKPAKGNVRFELDHKNRIKRRVSFIRAQNAKTDERKLWWSEEELDRIYERENKVYERYADNRTYKRKIQRLWGSCSKAAGPSASGVGGGGVKPLSPESLSHVAGSPCRGLEVDILETVRDRRARVIGSLLDAQDTLREFDPNIRTKVLSARYKNLCRAATRFARKMGEGDALEAANVYSD